MRIVRIFLLQNTNVDMLASFDEIQNSRSTETLQGVGSEVPRHDDSVTEAELEVDLTEHGNSFLEWMFVVRFHGQYLDNSVLKNGA